MNWLTRRLHPVFFISGVSLGILIGCGLAYFFPSTWFTSWVWWIVWLFWLGVMFWKSRRWMIIFVVLIGAMIGYSRGVHELASWVDLTRYEGRTVLLTGVVREDPEKGRGSELRVRLDDVRIDGRQHGGVYWVSLSTEQMSQIERSDRIEVSGKLDAGFATFAASMFRAQLLELHKRVRFDPLLDIRNKFSAAIHDSIPNPQAALGIGYILGQKRALPADFEAALLTVGLTHVVVASGYNLTILVRLSRRLFENVSRYLSVLVSGSLIAAFIGVTGMSPSMSRAGLVAGLSLVAWYYGRTIHPVVLLLITAAVSVLVNPSYLWGDVGWMLSFAAFAGVMFCAPLLQAYFYGDAKPSTARQILGETFSAQLLTLPLILVTFGVVSNVALLANLLVLPLVPLAMLLTFVGGLVTLAMPLIGWIVALPGNWLLTYMTWIINLLAELPWASMEVSISVPAALAMYGVIFVVLVWLKRRTRFSFRRVNLVE